MISNPVQTKAIASADVTTDKVDANVLAKARGGGLPARG
jgi:hypothetical protein